MLSCKEEVLSITKQLVEVESVVNTQGEAAMAHHIYETISQWPYFKNNPSSLVLEKTLNDEQVRYNVLARVEGTKAPSPRTMILMGHLDTVGIEDFNQLKPLACSPDPLREEMRKEEVSPLIREHLESGEWMFGRGSLDMKSGVASHMYLLKYYSENPDLLSGNLILISECDEEDSSHGILSALKTLLSWKKEYGLDYVGAINSDFVSPRYEGDNNRYIYRGTVGKLLPSFFITGAETHVGSCFEGLDPNFIAAYLTKQINYNPELCDEGLGEITVPPVSLKQTDLKPSYTVQTALSAYVYYNFFVHSWTPKDVLDKLKQQAELAFSQALEEFKNNYQAYCKSSGEPYREPEWKPRVLTYEEMDQQLQEFYGETYSLHMREFKEQLLEDQSLDTRMFSARVVEEAWKWMKDRSPAIILFYSSLYSPRIELSGKDEKERTLIEGLDKALEEVQPYYPHPMVIRNFFPYISDMSFVALSDDEQAIDAMIQNTPCWGKKLKVEFDDIRALQVPVINIGPYGWDAHKKYERVEMEYSFHIVPNLTNSVIQYLLGE
ncbi:M20/M25/M40 family metallo-hydrolase [Ammoniphilus sp. CFH 90114]|uniref:M20/M25/M40 family metallo-hydrolase n=1 Tax=Ammoniphilus sp. CFH 90114 TaxID=2493665 RepID=UPI00100F28D6|nr:M20/M25/M40 family metallo-hydrolase [Ammoniphilus sp. CFH 90114]RXT07089.1 M20/M25/M40 family metallo-hydrolase [Ammoniphilus sp. CFH 90114]